MRAGLTVRGASEGPSTDGVSLSLREFRPGGRQELAPGGQCCPTEARSFQAPHPVPMRSAFPALHDRLLATLFWTACAILVLTIAAIFMQRPRQAETPTAPVVTHPLVFTGASPSQ